MRRYTIYIFIALLTFTFGSFIAFQFLLEIEKPHPKKEKPKMIQNNIPANTETFYDFYSAENVYSLPEVSQKTEKGEKPFCRDKRILPVWALLLKDEYFIEQSGNSFQMPNCSDMFEVMFFDLNQDGKNEILLRGKSPDTCGAVGNCGFWVFEKKGKKYRKILSDADFVDITKIGNQIRREKTNGYHQIITKGHWNASDTRHSIFTFNGQKYIESKCLVDYYIRGTSPDKWNFISCRQYEKLADY